MRQQNDAREEERVRQQMERMQREYQAEVDARDKKEQRVRHSVVIPERIIEFTNTFLLFHSAVRGLKLTKQNSSR